MARTDDDSWDITESVGATALGVAAARAAETASEKPLFTDPYAQMFIDAAKARGWSSPFSSESAGPQQTVRLSMVRAYAAARTKWFDEFFASTSAAGIRQVVILAAGLDARAWRLPWPDGTTVFVEVRKRSSLRHGGAAASVGGVKQRRIVFAARHYLLRLHEPPPCRFDVVAIDGDELSWLKGAFGA